MKRLDASVVSFAARRFLAGSGLVACSVFVACSGGGTPVEVFGPGPGADEPTDGTLPGGPTVGSGSPSGGNGQTTGQGTTTSGSGAGGSDPSGATSSTATGGGDCITCAAYVSGDFAGTTFCEPSMAIVTALFQCACSGCTAECEPTCQAGEPAGSTCQACAQELCPAELSDCLADGG